MLKIVRALCVFFALCASTSIASDRTQTYSGQISNSTQINQQPRDDRTALGILARDVFGSALTTGNGTYTNLSVVPNGGMYVAVQPAGSGPGSVYQIGPEDPLPLPNNQPVQLSADTTPIAILGVQRGPYGGVGPMTAPASGSSIVYLVEAHVSVADGPSSTVYFQNTTGGKNAEQLPISRSDVISYQVIAGTAASSPVAPTATSGWVGIATVTIPSGTTAIASGMIAPAPPFGGFIAAGGTPTVAGLILQNLSAGCLTIASNGAVSSQPCTSGLGSIAPGYPITASASGGVASIGCPTCVTNVQSGTGLSSSGGTTPTLALSHGDYVGLSGAQTIAGAKTFTSNLAAPALVAGSSTYGSSAASIAGPVYGGDFQAETPANLFAFNYLNERGNLAGIGELTTQAAVNGIVPQLFGITEVVSGSNNTTFAGDYAGDYAISGGFYPTSIHLPNGLVLNGTLGSATPTLITGDGSGGIQQSVSSTSPGIRTYAVTTGGVKTLVQQLTPQGGLSIQGLTLNGPSTTSGSAGFSGGMTVTGGIVADAFSDSGNATVGGSASIAHGLSVTNGLTVDSIASSGNVLGSSFYNNGSYIIQSAGTATASTTPINASGSLIFQASKYANGAASPVNQTLSATLASGVTTFNFAGFTGPANVGIGGGSYQTGSSSFGPSSANVNGPITATSVSATGTGSAPSIGGTSQGVTVALGGNTFAYATTFPSGSAGYALGWNGSNGGYETDLYSVNGNSTGFNFYSVNTGSTPTAAILFSLDASGDATAPGNFYSGGSTYGASASIAGSLLSGDITTYRSATTGSVFYGSNGQHYTYFDGTNYQMPGGALTGPTAYYTSSRRALKRDIRPLNLDPLAIVRATKIVRFNYKTEKRGTFPHTGFIADDTPTILSGPAHDHYDVNAVAAIDMAALKELDVRLARDESRISELESRRNQQGTDQDTVWISMAVSGSVVLMGYALSRRRAT